MAGLDNFPGLAKNVSIRTACPLQPGKPCNLCHPNAHDRPQDCPLQPGKPCNLCHPNAHDRPQDCPLVAIVLDDDALRKVMREKKIDYKGNTG